MQENKRKNRSRRKSAEESVHEGRDSLATVATNALLLSILIDAKERRDVATADVSGAYVPADMKDFTLLKMEGESLNIM
jgi:hypothetical protein